MMSTCAFCFADRDDNDGLGHELTCPMVHSLAYTKPCVGCGAAPGRAHRVNPTCPKGPKPLHPKCAGCGREDDHHNAWCPKGPNATQAAKTEPPPPGTLKKAVRAIVCAGIVALVAEHLDAETWAELARMAEENARARRTK